MTTSITGNKSLDALLKRNEPAAPEENGDSFSDLCGLSSRYATQGVVLVLQNGDRVGVLYGSICSAIVFIPTQGIHFQFVDAGEIVKRVLILGTDKPESIEQLKTIHRHLTQGKREELHCKPPIITDISIEDVVVEEEKA